MNLWKDIVRRHSPRPRPPVVPEPPAAPAPRKLGLALGGGGGKGGAHLGVLAVLAEQGIAIDAIAGTSVGAVVGMLFAAGYSLDQIATVFRSAAIRRIAAPDPSRMGLFGNTRRLALLQRLFGSRTFEELPIPCAVVTADLVSGQEVVIRNGPIVPALLASTALPGIFPPVQVGDQLLIDGGIFNNVPVDVAFGLGVQRVIAVELTGVHTNFSLPTDVPSNPLARLALAPRQFAIATRALALLMQVACERRMAQTPPDLLIRPDVGALPTLDMNHPEAGFALGAEAARAALRDWQAEAGVYRRDAETRSV